MAADSQLKRLGNYELVSKVSSHSSSTWYEAVEVGSDRKVVVGLQRAAEDDEKLRGGFREEAAKLESLHHPNVARVLDHGATDEYVYLVEKAAPCMRLSDLLRERRLSLAESLRLFKQVASGLGAAHEAGLVHHILDPGLVLVSEDLALVQIRGFCFRPVSSTASADLTVGITHSSMARLDYMAPEQARDRSPATAQTNIYALGVMFYEMLTGRLPRGRFNLPSSQNPEVPSDLDAFVLKCVAPQASDRFDSIRRLESRLAAVEDQMRLGLVHELQGLGRSTARVLRSDGNPRRPGWPVWVAVGVLLTLALLIAFFLLRS